MKIVYLHQYFNTPNMPGSTRSYEFAKRLSLKGHTVYMITSNWQNKAKDKFSIEEGINVFWGSIKYSNKMSFFRRISSFIMYIIFSLRIGRKLSCDIIIASSTPLTVGITALILKKTKKAKLIFEVRDVWPKLPIAMGVLKSKFLIYLSKKLEKLIYKNSDKIIALSEDMKNEILNIEPYPKKVTTITNLCDIEKFNINKRNGLAFRKKILKIKDEPLIVYAGSFGKINNVYYLIEIANELKKIGSNIKFLLVGNGYQISKIRNEINRLKLLKNKIFLFDYLPKNKLPEILSAATIVSSVFIDLPEMEMNSANKFFDGLAAGKPIMLNYGGWQADLIKKNNAGFIIPNNDPIQASLIIENYLNDKNKISYMCNESKRISRNFSIQANFKKLNNIISKIL